MGDRTYVNLTVLAIHEDRARALFGGYQPEDEETQWGLFRFGFSEVNYGELPFLSALQQAGIAYDSCWADGDDYPAGNRYLRFTEDGQVQVLTTVESTEGLIELGQVLQQVRQQGQSLAGVETWLLEQQAHYTPLPWIDQDTYGKRYRAIQLITP